MLISINSKMNMETISPMKADTLFQKIKFCLVLVTALVCSHLVEAQTNRPISAEPVGTYINSGDDLIVNSNKLNGSYYTTRVAFSNTVSSVASNLNFGLLSGPPGYLTNLTAAKNADAPRTFDENAAWNAIHRQQWEDATNLVETWSDLTQWSSQNVFVSGGSLYAQSIGNPSGANHAFQLGTLDEARITFTLTVPAVAASSNAALCFVGVSSDTAGAIPASGDVNGVGIGIWSWTNSSEAVFFNKGSYTYDSTNAMPAGVYAGYILIDTNNVCFSLTYPGGTNHFVQTVSRSSLGAINNVHIWSSDARTNNGGVAINALAARLAFETSTVRQGIEGQGECLQWTTDDNGQNLLVWVPPSYDSRVPLPLLIKCHGYGWDEKFVWIGQNLGGNQGQPERPYYQQLVTNNWILCSGNFHGNAWGNSNAVNDVTAALKWMRRHYAINSVWLEGSSMGGLTALNWIGRHAGEANGFIGLYNVASLGSMIGSFSTYSNAIVTAYGGNVNGSDFLSYSAGFDPMLEAANRFWRVPTILFYDPLDSVVPPAQNEIPFAAKVTGLNSETSSFTQSGAGHGGSALYQASTVLQWRERNSNLVGPTNHPPSGPSVVVNGLRSAGNITTSGSITSGGNITSGGSITSTGNIVGPHVGNGAGLTNIALASVTPQPVTNGQAGVTLASVNGPSEFAAANYLVMSAALYGFSWNDQTNVNNLMILDQYGELIIQPDTATAYPLTINSKANQTSPLMRLQTNGVNVALIGTNGGINLGDSVDPGKGSMIVSSNLYCNRIGYGYGSGIPNIQTNSGAGIGGSITGTNSCTDVAGTFTLTTGSSTVANTNLCTITFSRAYSTPPIPVGFYVWGPDQTAQSNAKFINIGSITSSNCVIMNGSTAASASRVIYISYEFAGF